MSDLLSRHNGVKFHCYISEATPPCTLLLQLAVDLWSVRTCSRTVRTYSRDSKMARKKKSVLNKKNLFHKGNTFSPKRRPTGYRRVICRSADGSITLEGGRSKKDTTAIVRPCRRYTKQEFEHIVKRDRTGRFTIPGPDGNDGAAIMLRPLTEDSQSTVSAEGKKGGPSRFQIHEGNILVEKSRLMDAINSAIKEHSTLPCVDMNLDLVDFVPWGHYVKAKVSCTSCGYQSDQHNKLYEEAEKKGPGPKEAKGNLRLQYLLQEMPIGNEKARLVLAALGIRAGSLSGMQQNANKVGEATVQLNQADMSKWAEEVKEVLMCRGVDNPDVISASFDARYDGASFKSWVTPGHGANAATGLIVENITSDKKVIAMHHSNKLCPLGTRLRGSGVAAKCGVGDASHEGCTATMPYSENMSEKQMATEMATSLHSQHNIVISHITTDSDALGAQGIQETYNEKGISQTVTNYKDPIHLAGSQRRRILKHKFNADTFGHVTPGGKWKSEELRKCKQALAHDVEVRCAHSVSLIFDYYKNDTAKIKTSVNKIVDYMMLCYRGHHSKCKTATLAKLTGCRGTDGHTWYDLSDHLSGQRIACLNLTEEDEMFLRSVIGLKLSCEGVDDIAQLTSTQKVEAVNRAINMSDPKNNHWARNAVGRNAAAVHRINNGPLKSIEKKLHHGRCSLPRTSPATQILQDYESRRQYTRQYQRLEASQRRARELKREKIQNYYDSNFKRHNMPDYLKYQLDIAKANRRSSEAGMEDVIPSCSTDEGVAKLNDKITQCELEVKETRKQIKNLKKQERKKKLMTLMKKRRTWQRNAPKHAERLRKKRQAREAYYKAGSEEANQIRSEHKYASIKQGQ